MWCMQCGTPMSFMPGFGSQMPFSGPIPGAFMPMPQVGTTAPGTPFAAMPPMEEVQAQQLRFQQQQLQLMKQQLDLSLETVTKALADTEAALKKIESAKTKKNP